MKYLVVIGSLFLSIGCGSNAAPVQNTNAASQLQRAEKLQSTTVHTTEGQATPPVVNEDAAAAADSAKGGKFSAGGNPIDTTEFDEEIKNAEIKLASVKRKPPVKTKSVGDDATRNLADAFFERGFALTEARQYAAALKDYRSALKLVPDHAESIKWEKQIIGIYEMMKKEYPKPGEEPSPLPFAKKEP